MKLTVIDPPREFGTGRGSPIAIKDCARIALEPNEQVTFTTEAGAEYDVTRKPWGFYATPSINGRLLNFNLRTALVKNAIGKYYVFLVEHGKEADLRTYMEPEGNRIVRWLDNDADLAALDSSEVGASRAEPAIHCMCGGDRFTTAHMYFEAPAGEVRFPLPASTPYRREVFRCSLCAHYVSVHTMLGDELYTGSYVDSTYGDAAGVRRTFDRIVSLPRDKSDNAGRVDRVVAFARSHGTSATPSVLDVGSGLCVFLHGMKKAGWACTALDPDARAAQHAREVVGVNAVCGDFMNVVDIGRFDVVTFNKVLEHVPDPVAMLRASRPLLRDGGFVYVELPDGEEAAREGFHREEFFIEHLHVFSAASIATLAARAGFVVHTIERLREPSSKYTLRAFCVPASPS